jgi:hypothetical protein
LLFLCVVIHSSVFSLLWDSSLGDGLTSHVVVQALYESNSFCKMVIINCAELSSSRA